MTWFRATTGVAPQAARRAVLARASAATPGASTARSAGFHTSTLRRRAAAPVPGEDGCCSAAACWRRWPESCGRGWLKLGKGMGFLLLLHVLPVAVATWAPTTRAWGEEGHYMTCKIAEGFLASEASAAVEGLLPAWANGELTAVCSWSDVVRRQIPWSGSLHFADTPGDCKFSYASTCSAHWRRALGKPVSSAGEACGEVGDPPARAGGGHVPRRGGRRADQGALI